MITCEKCKLILDEGTRNCPRCGDPLNVAGPHEGPKPTDTHPLLASANLSRIRGEWDEAIELCMEALKLEPKNAEIYSLLGDIYESRGQDEEAAQWFTMALDLAPTNKTDKIKLDRLREKFAKLEVSNLPPSAGDYLSWFDRFAMGRSMPSYVRITTVVSVVFVALLLIAGLLAFIWRSPNLDAELEERLAQQETVEEESISDHSEGGSSLVVDTSSIRSALEQQVLATVSSDSRVRARNVAVEDVKIDPRIGLLMVTFRTAGPLTRAAVSADAISVADAVFAGSTETSWAMIRCYGSVTNEFGSPALDLLFVADIERGAAAAVDAASPIEDLDQAFVKPWWNLRVQ